MNLTKADRKVFLPPRENQRKRTPKKKDNDFQDEVRRRHVAPCIRASLSLQF